MWCTWDKGGKEQLHSSVAMLDWTCWASLHAGLDGRGKQDDNPPPAITTAVLGKGPLPSPFPPPVNVSWAGCCLLGANAGRILDFWNKYGLLQTLWLPGLVPKMCSLWIPGSESALWFWTTTISESEISWVRVPSISTRSFCWIYSKRLILVPSTWEPFAGVTATLVCDWLSSTMGEVVQAS